MSTPANPQELVDTAEILIVDDDADALAAGAALLSVLGYRVHAARSGADALALLQANEHIAVLLTDVAMPGQNGFELAAAAKALRPDLGVIYVTGYSRDLLPSGRRVPGRILAKPWTADELQREIRLCLDGRQA